MQCPGCGFENEKGNKFCNMCGMGLPGTGETQDSPAEREPLDLDLSLDLDVNGAADVAGGLSFDLSTPADNSFDLSAGAADEPGELQLDMPETSAKSELNLDLGSADDFSFDANAGSPDNSLDLDISMEQADSGLNFDMNLESGHGTALAADEDPFAAPAGFDISLDDSAAADDSLISAAFDEPAAPAPVSKTPVNRTPVAPAPVAPEPDEFSFSVDNSTDSLDVSRELDAEAVAVETESFDFGDLDSSPSVATTAGKPATKPATAASLTTEDDDLSGLIVSNNEDLGTTTDFSVSIEDDADAEDDNFLDSLVVETVQPASKPAPTPAQAVPAAPAGRAQTKAAAPATPLSHQAARPAPVVKAPATPAVGQPEADEDEELNGLILGIEGLAPAKPAAAKTQSVTVDYEEDFSATVEDQGNDDADFDISSLGTLGGEMPTAPRAAEPETFSPTSPSVMLEEPRPSRRSKPLQKSDSCLPMPPTLMSAIHWFSDYASLGFMKLLQILLNFWAMNSKISGKSPPVTSATLPPKRL